LIADRDRDDIIKPSVFANPAVIADSESPGVFDLDAGFDVYAVTDVGTEEAEGEDFEAGDGEEGGADDAIADVEPEELFPEGGTGVIGADGVLIEAHRV
jgi:hypothetical protein